MTQALQDLYAAYDGEDNATTAAYEAARAAKVREIADYIRDHLANPELADRLAKDVMANAEEMGRFDGDCINGEIPSRYTASGNPLPFTI